MSGRTVMFTSLQLRINATSCSPRRRHNYIHNSSLDVYEHTANYDRTRAATVLEVRDRLSQVALEDLR